MARYSGPVCKLCRRENVKLLLKGERCLNKCPIDKKKDVKKTGSRRYSKKISEYGRRLREKQRAKLYAGMLERQFRKYFRKAETMKGLTGENLLLLIEMRLDNIVRRLGFASSLSSARQLVCHGHVLVNGRRVDIPSYQVRPGDTISLMESMHENIMFKQSIENMTKRKNIPLWLELHAGEAKGKVLKYPAREEMSVPVEEQLIVELYSK